MLFSVYIPMYNAEKYIEETIKSILAQTFYDFELIVVNDGSTDHSVSIVQKFIAKDNRVKLINQDNQGVFKARIKAISNSIGDYIVSVDSDDLLVPNALELLSNVIKQEGGDTIFFKMDRFADKRNYFSELEPANKKWNITRKIVTTSDVKKYQADLLLTNCYGSLCTKIFKKNLISEYLQELNKIPNFNIGEDNLISMYCALNIKRVIMTDLCLYHYRLNTASLTQSMNVTILSSWIMCYKFRKEFLVRFGLDNLLNAVELYSTKELSKLIVYNPYSVRGRDGYRKYKKMLDQLRNTPECYNLLKVNPNLSVIYRLPIFLYRHNADAILFCMKNLVSTVRRLLQR